MRPALCDYLYFDLSLTAIFLTVPADPPQNLTLLSTSPFSITINWHPPTVPNGIIVSYTITVALGNGSQLILRASANSTARAFLIGDLLPYQTMNISVSASTVIGGGPGAVLSTITDEYGELNITLQDLVQY